MTGKTFGFYILYLYFEITKMEHMFSSTGLFLFLTVIEKGPR